ncbi:MAG: lipoprotein signal peptidase [Deltaproteobacteria bacterium]|nr:lipoprotein signal peptidase [Deltaproteobacteria bacterium]
MNAKYELSDLIPVGVAAAVIIVDQVTKLWIMTVFALHEQLTVIPGFFNLVYVTNTGAAFGFLAGDKTWLRQFFFVTVSIVALVVIALAYNHLKKQSRIFVYSLGLIAGGAVGNLIDRLRFGSVVDFLDFYLGSYHWPAFNAADSAITVGVGLFLLGTLLQQIKEGREHSR